MKYVPPNVVEEIKRIDLFTYLKTYEPNELVHVSGNEYTTKTNGSLKISNGLWNWCSRGIGGRNAVDFLIKVRGYTFKEAIDFLIEKTKISPINYEEIKANTYKNIEEKQLILPEKSPTNFKIKSYLMGRGIDEEIIDYCLKNNFIYEDIPYKNVVFVRI